MVGVYYTRVGEASEPWYAHLPCQYPWSFGMERESFHSGRLGLEVYQHFEWRFSFVFPANLCWQILIEMEIKHRKSAAAPESQTRHYDRIADIICVLLLYWLLFDIDYGKSGNTQNTNHHRMRDQRKSTENCAPLLGF